LKNSAGFSVRRYCERSAAGLVFAPSFLSASERTEEKSLER
jgi:hypothetical protein